MFIEAGAAIRTPGEVPVDQGKIPLGKARIHQEGRDITIVSYSTQFLRCIEAVKELEAAGISVELVEPAHNLAVGQGCRVGLGREDRRAIVVHEALRAFGPGAEMPRPSRRSCSAS